MNRSQKFLKNSAVTAMYQIVVMITGFILPKVMLSIYGSRINGVISSITQFISYITLVEAGLSSATVYSLYRPLAERDYHQTNRVLVAAKNFYYKTGVLFVILITIGAFVYPYILKDNILSYTETFVLVFILGFSGALDFFTLAKYSALLTADQKTYVISLCNIVQVILNCLIVIGLSFCGTSIILVRLVALIAILVRSIVLWIYCRNHYRYLDFSVEPDNSSMDKRWDAMYQQLLKVVHNGSVVMIASALLSLVDVSIYAIYNTVIHGINSVLSIFTSGLAAGFGELIAKKEQKKLQNAFEDFEYLYLAVITIVYSVMMVCYLPFIKVYTKGADTNYVIPILAVVLTLNGYFYNLKTPQGMIVISAGLYKETRWRSTIQCALEVGCGILFGFIGGLPGIVFGAIIANVYRCIDLLLFVPKYITGLPVWSTLKKWLISMSSFAAVVLISNLLLKDDFVESYLTWVMWACINGILAVLVVLIIFSIFDKKVVRNIINRMKILVVKKR